MALQKQSVNINFAQGLDTKTDPRQVQPGKFLALQNTIFDKGGRLEKRNGFGQLPSLPDTNSTYCTTFNGNLTAIGTTLQAYNAGSKRYVNKGNIQGAELDVLSLIRSNTNQIQCDTAISSNGLVCTVFTDNIPSAGSNVATYKYVIADVLTGQNIVAPAIITPTSGAVVGSPRVFALGKYFIVVFTNLISATNHLQYISINTANPSSVSANVDISATYTPDTKVNFDGVVANNNLYLAWNGSDGGGAIRVTYIDSTLVQHNTVSFAGKSANIISVCADTTGTNPVVYVSFYKTSGTAGYTLAVNQQLDTVLAATQIISSGTILNITSSAQNGVCTVFYEVSNNYSYDSGIPSHYIQSKTVTQAGSVGSAVTVKRSLGLASKSFIVNGTIYFSGIYYSIFQPTYFICSSSGTIICKLAYSNGGSYLTLGLPSVFVDSDTAQFGYLIKDLIQAVNKTQGATTAAGVYSQTGINLASLSINSENIITAEIGNNLNISGGILWAYDGYAPVEQGFNVWPDNIECTWSATGGSIHAQPDGSINTNAYYYQVTYEWTDNQGNLFRSAPSVPVGVTTTSNGTSGSITVNIPTLRLTAKTANPVKLVVYRWSVAQQTYYQTTSVIIPTLNDTTADSIAYVDTLADASILGNNILYTTGGIVENIGPPASSSVSLYKARQFLIDAEDKNLLWYSKQVIESTPVEFSDLFTIYVAPTISAQGSTGPMKCLSSMDDKLVIFKRDAIYYLVGNGPDNTGANNDFSEPVFITSTVGCANQNSIVFIPQGLMFQSDKGIWLLNRNLNTSYIGAPVEDFNQYTVKSAINIPGTNQVRFTLSNGVTLMYDYFYDQWGTFVGVPAISSTLYENLHTYINSYGQVFQETVGTYLDGSRPVLISFTTSWLNFAGLQGFERAYFFYLNANYLSPHKLSVGIAYDYSSAIEQSSTITPDNFNPLYGGDPLYGNGNPYGGNPSLEPWRVFLQKQKCQAFQITISEFFDNSLGQSAGAGFTMSGLDVVVGMKGSYPRLKASNSVG